jgi:hypothetical protein
LSRRRERKTGPSGRPRRPFRARRDLRPVLPILARMVERTLLIDADSEDTWPEALLQGLEAGRRSIAAYHLVRARLDRKAELDVIVRNYRPINEYQAEWDAALALAERATASQQLLGFHASRLTEDEGKEIEQCGLRPLSVELLERRLAALLKACALGPEQAARLLESHQAANDHRSGMTWFSFSRATLKDEGAIERLLRSWGGEALYWSHEDDEETGPLLKNLGRPCIVFAALRVADIETYKQVGHRLLNTWCARRGICTGDSPETAISSLSRSPTVSRTPACRNRSARGIYPSGTEPSFFTRPRRTRLEQYAPTSAKPPDWETAMKGARQQPGGRPAGASRVCQRSAKQTRSAETL